MDLTNWIDLNNVKLLYAQIGLMIVVLSLPALLTLVFPLERRVSSRRAELRPLRDHHLNHDRSHSKQRRAA